LSYSATASLGHSYRPGCVAAVVVVVVPVILPTLAFSFPLLTASADLLSFFRGEESWVVEVISGIKLVDLVSRVAPPSVAVDVLPGTLQHGRCQYGGGL